MTDPQPPYGQHTRPQDYTTGLPASRPQPGFAPYTAPPTRPPMPRPAGKHYGLTGAEPFWYILGCISLGTAYFLKLPARKAAAEVFSELQADGGGPVNAYGLTSAGTFWYVLGCILGAGAPYFMKVYCKKGMWEVIAALQAAPGDHAEAIRRALYGPG